MQTDTGMTEITLKSPKGMIDLVEPSQMLLEQMKLVKQSPTHIEQAQSMCDISNRICDMAKTQAAQASIIISLTKLHRGE